jgi:hypothetical protein
MRGDKDVTILMGDVKAKTGADIKTSWEFLD